nr:MULTISPECIES: hypothetical protein [Burkholderia]
MSEVFVYDHVRTPRGRADGALHQITPGSLASQTLRALRERNAFAPDDISDVGLGELQARTRTFINDKIMPFEVDPRCGPHGPGESLRAELIALGRAERSVLEPCEPRFRWPRARPHEQGDAVRRGWLFAVGPGCAQHCRARRRQHASAA